MVVKCLTVVYGPSQSVPPTIWYRLVAGLNAQLRLVRRGLIKITFSHVVSWIETHANPSLGAYGIRADLAWFQPTSSGYFQFGLVLWAIDIETLPQSIENLEGSSPVDGQLR